MKTRIFCFPYAGGSAVIFHKWRQYTDKRIELVPVELAGRGVRIEDALYKDIPDVVEDAFRIIKDRLQEGPYALFGHSMGAKIVYHLAKKIIANGLHEPEHLFFSGRKAPGVKSKKDKVYHLMAEDDFRREVLELGGTPPEFFEHRELLEVFLPLLKNDFRLSETEVLPDGTPPFNMDISVFLGKEEDLGPEQCVAWKQHTRGLCNIHYFEGGHFFLHQQPEILLKVMAANLYYGKVTRDEKA